MNPTLRTRTTRRPSSAALIARPIELLEGRILFHLENVAALPSTTVNAGDTSAAITLTNFIANELIPGSLVRMTTELGNIDVAMLDQAAPQSVANFLNNYVNADRYNNSIFHRSAQIQTGPSTFEPFVIQGGGFRADTSVIATDADPDVPNEFDPVARSNVRGTLAYAKGSDPDSATSQFFFNMRDNSGPLDNPNNSGGFAVFGRIVAGLDVADAIAGLPREEATLGGFPFNEVPSQQVPPDGTAAGDEFVVISDASQIAPYNFVAQSSNPALVTPTVTGNALTLAAAAGQTGTADITITATDTFGDTVQQTFTVTVVPEGELNVTLGGVGGPQSVTFTDADGTATTIKFAGRGGAASDVRLVGAGLTSTTGRRGVQVAGAVDAVRRIGVDAASTTADTLTVTTRGGDGRVTVNEIDVDGALKSIAARTADFAQATDGGGIDVAGAVSKVDLGSSNVALINVGGAVSNFNVGGNLAGSVTAGSIRSMSVRGNYADGTLTLTQPFAAGAVSLGKLTVTEAMTNVDVVSGASVGTVTTGTIAGSSVYAGVATPDGTLPDAPSDFANAATIAGLTVKSKAAGAFSNTVIAADTLNRVTLGSVATANGGVPFGIAADSIASLNASGPGGARIRLSRLDDPTAAATAVAALGDLGDFAIRVL